MCYNCKYKLRLIPGKNRGLTLIIDSHSNILSPSTVRDDFEGFMAIVNSRSKFPSLFEKVILKVKVFTVLILNILACLQEY